MNDDARQDDDAPGPRIASRRKFLLGAGAAAMQLLSGHADAQQQGVNLNDLAQMPKLKEPMVPKTFMVPMRDGVKLALDVYLPKGDGPWPVILERTPYSRRQPFMYQIFNFYPEAGFALAVQDCRGRFDSEGAYKPWSNDMEDGYYTVECLATQSWSTGKIGMTGDSAMGIVSYEAAILRQPHLVAAAVFCCSNAAPTL